MQICFDECYNAVSLSDIEGVVVPFLHINHLIQNKKAVDRPKDRVDIIYLEKIKKVIDEENQKNQ